MAAGNPKHPESAEQKRKRLIRKRERLLKDLQTVEEELRTLEDAEPVLKEQICDAGQQSVSGTFRRSYEKAGFGK